MEFYLVDELECDLTVFHPYRPLMTLCKKEGGTPPPETQVEAGELGIGIGEDDGPRYWGSGEGQLELPEGGLQMAWYVVSKQIRMYTKV
jgi:cyclin C